MAHEIETAFFHAQPAWHGLGKVLDHPPTLAETLRQAGLDWSVIEAPLVAKIPSGGAFPTSEIETGHKALIRDSDRSLLGVVTNVYRTHQNADALAFLEPLIESGAVQMEAGGALRRGRRVWLLGRYCDPIDVAPNDPLLPFILFATSHDGTMATQVCNTAVRVVCANTLRAAGVQDGLEELDFGVNKDGRVSINHVGDPTERFERAREALQLARQRCEDAALIYRTMGQYDVTADQVVTFAREVFDPDYVKARALIRKIERRLSAEEAQDTAETRAALREKANELEAILSRPSRIAESITAAFESAPGSAEAGKTVWGLYNAATWFIDHERGRSQESRLEASWFGAGRQLRNKAFAAGVALVAGGAS